ncbi:MAG: NifU family protein [Bacteroidetes bacterium]|nr:NifU family protein [Bacteroidota bacterium]
MTTNTVGNKPIDVYAEATPNPDSLKFVINRLLAKGASFDFDGYENAVKSPLAQALFEFPFVKRVFIANNFITITKPSDDMWVELIPKIRNFIRDYLSSNERVFAEDINLDDANYAMSDDDGEVVTKIKEILNNNIRPAVEMDGGAIDFQNYEDGIVTLTMKGACSGCPSSMVTLKSGIEALLKRVIPEVKEVVAHQE